MTADDAFYAGKHVMVTGGFGFVGSHLVAALLQRGATVTVLDLDCSPDRPSLLNLDQAALATQCRTQQGDVVDEEALATLFGQHPFDVVFHLAANSVIERSTRAPRDSVRTNVMGVVNLLESIARSRVQDPSSIVMVSTDKVYGESGAEATRETAALAGTGLYEAAKVAGDTLARAFYGVYGLPTVVVRPCNIFGPHDYNVDFRIVPRALSAIHGRRVPRPPVLYFDSIRHLRDFLYVDDAVAMILAVGANQTCVGEAFNLAGCVNLTTPDLLRTVVDVAADYERKFDPERAEQILANGINVSLQPLESKAVTIERQCMDGLKLAQWLGVRPTVGIEEGLRRTVPPFREYYRGPDT